MSDDGREGGSSVSGLVWPGLGWVQSEISIRDGAMAENIKITFLSEQSKYANRIKINHFNFHFGESKAVKVRRTI